MKNEKSRIMRWIVSGLISVMMLETATLANAQNSGNVVKITGFDAGNFPQVRAFVSVTDSNGRALQTLGKDAFKIVEDGRDVELVAINASQDPIHFGLLIDRSGSMSQQNKLSDARIAASAFVDELRSQDEAFVTMFDDQTTPLQDFTSDHTALQRAINQIAVNGGTAFYDAAFASTQKFESRKELRKNALILLTDGLDNREDWLQSAMGAGSKHTLDEAIAKAKELKVAVYTIGLGSDADGSRLQKMASETGGKYFPAPSGTQLKELYRLIAEQLQKEYAVDFKTPRAIADGTQRKVKLTVKLPNGETQTVDGLYVAGFLFNRIHADWLIGIMLGSILLLLALAPTIISMIAKQMPAPRQVMPPAQTQLPTPVPQSPVVYTTCPRCGQPIRATARFCPHCAVPINPTPTAVASSPTASAPMRICPNCKHQVRAEAKFCGFCRTPMR